MGQLDRAYKHCTGQLDRAYTLYKTIGQSLTYFQVEVSQKGQLHLDNYVYYQYTLSS